MTKSNRIKQQNLMMFQEVFYGILVMTSVVMVFPMLVLAYFSSYYDSYFNCLFGERIRSIVSRRFGFSLVPLVPFYVFTWSFVEMNNSFISFIWFVLGIVFIEIHSVCLHRESWIAAFEPEWIPENAFTLGGKPIRKADRRLHHLLFIIVIYAIPLVIIGVSIPIRFNFQSFITALFIIRYFEYARIDFETCIHWNMHCHVLKIENRPFLSRFWEILMDYFVGPLSGYVPRIYNANHLLVHHSFNGNPRDIHSTTMFRRNSFLEFCFFAMKLAGSIMFATDLIFHKNCRGQRRFVLLLNLIGFWFVVGFLFVFGRILAPLLVLFAIHHSVIMARFQYVWHGLIHPDDPSQTLTTTTLWVSNESFWSNLVNGKSTSIENLENLDEVPEPGTHWPFFDNFHLLHHLKPHAHFSQYTNLLKENVSEIVRSRCAVLTLDIIATFPFDCWTSNFDRIATGLLIELSDDEKREFIRNRLEPVKEIRHPIGSMCETPLARFIEKNLLKFLQIFTDGQ